MIDRHGAQNSRHVAIGNGDRSVVVQNDFGLIRRARDFDLARARTTIARSHIGVVAGFCTDDDSITAHRRTDARRTRTGPTRFHAAGGIATITGGRIAVVAGFGSTQNAIATRDARAHCTGARSRARRAHRAIHRDRIAAHAGHRIAHTGDMTLIGSHTRDGVCPGASPGRTGIRLRARIAVVAHRAIRGIGMGTHARHRITHARDVALVGRHADDWVRSIACPGRTGIRLRTRIAVVAHGSIHGIGIGTHAGHWITGAGDVALIRGHTGDGRACRANTHLTGVHGRTQIRIHTRRTIGRIRMVWHTRCAGFTRTRIAIVERQVGIVGNIDDRAGAVAYVQKTIVVRLHHDGRVGRSVAHAANGIVTRSRAAFGIRSRAIGARDTSDALPAIIADERISAAVHSAIGTRRPIGIRRHTTIAHIIRAGILVDRQIRVVGIVFLSARTVANRDLAITCRLRRNRSIRRSIVESAFTRRTGTSLAGIIRSCTIHG